MCEPGFIKDPLDIKILILFVLSQLPGEIKLPALTELVMVDGGFGYFDFTECLNNLEETRHISRRDDVIEITEKGRENCAAVENGIPYSVRQRALSLTEPTARAMRRAAMIKASHREAAGGYVVELSLADGIGELLGVRLLAASEATAAAIEEGFKRDPEGYFDKITRLFVE